MWFLRFKHYYLTVELELTQSYILQMFKHLLILIDFATFFVCLFGSQYFFFSGLKYFQRFLENLWSQAPVQIMLDEQNI